MKVDTNDQAASPPTSNWKSAEFFLNTKNCKTTDNLSINNQNTLLGSSTESQSILPDTLTQNTEILEASQHYGSAQNDDSNFSSEGAK